MPIEMKSAEDVFSRISRNKRRIYPQLKRGAERISPYAQPGFTSEFSFEPNASIFATGSCFARNVEKSLRFVGTNVVSSPEDIPVPGGTNQIAPLYNKYTVHSILNELRWALGAEKPDIETLLVEDKKTGRYLDLQVTSSTEVSGTLEQMIAFRSAFNASFARARSADVVIMTLGLVECWYDTEAGVYLNAAPPKALTLQYPGRFEFHLLDYNDIYSALQEIYALLSAGDQPVPNMLFTVSPVPLASTFRTDDVLVSNCYSKSVQRAAVEAFTAHHNATYFPSYEYVTLSDRKFSWGNSDFRHVRQEAVDRIMADVLLAYIGPSVEQELLHLRGHATALFEHGDKERTVEMIEATDGAFENNPDILWLYARALNGVKRREDALDVCEKLMRLNVGLSRPAGRTALNLAKSMNLDTRLRQLVALHIENFPEEAERVENVIMS